LKEEFNTIFTKDGEEKLLIPQIVKENRKTVATQITFFISLIIDIILCICY
jgi:hypothetical protein